MKNKLKILLLVIFFFSIFLCRTHADEIKTITVIIRNGDSIIYQNQIPLPEAETISVSDKNGVTHEINSQSVLGLLSLVDNSSDLFLISDLEYYNSFGSFYVKCITPQNTSEICDNWQYAVGATTPQTGIDTTILLGGETVGLYFGSQHRIIFDSTTVTKGESITATAESYNYVNNTWVPLINKTIGITLPNSNDQWNPIVVSTYPVSNLGIAIFSINDPGIYTVGISEDYYFPSYQITVNQVAMRGSNNGIENNNFEQQTTISKTIFSVENAFSYLMNVQSNDGSFGNSEMYTDWVAIASGSKNNNEIIQGKILSYLITHNKISPLLTDNERRAMALLSLGQNPYSFNGINYIDSIIKSFDGTQFGDPSIVNDDIFALIPLTSSGYTISDDIIAKDTQHIILKQLPNGSWENSVDLTAAAIQALSPLQSILGASSAITKANNYIASQQQIDGGWGSVSSTSWVMQAENISNAIWIKKENTGQTYLSNNQSSDGGLLDPKESLQNRIWATSYAIPASLHKPWNIIMHTVSKQKQIEPPVSLIETNLSLNIIKNQKIDLDSNLQKHLKVDKQKIITVTNKTDAEPIIITSITKPETRISFHNTLTFIKYIFNKFIYKIYQ